MLDLFPVAAIALAAALTTADETAVPVPELEELGYSLTQVSTRGDFRLTGPNGEGYRSRRPDGAFQRFWVNVPADHTGDDIPELIVIQEMNWGSDVVHVFSLGPDAFTKILQTSSHVSDFKALQPGDPLPGYDPSQ